MAALPHQGARAAFHFMKIVEVFPGYAAFPNAQFVELQMYSSGQNFVQGHSINVYNAANVLVGTFTFSGMVANGANQSTILIATAEAQTLFGISADLTMTSAAIPAGGGKVCFDPDSAPIDCVAWGSYSGPSTHVGPPFPGGLTLGQSIHRRLDISGSPSQLEDADDTHDSANDFQLGIPSPRNNAGQQASTPSLSIDDPSIAEGNSGTTNSVFTVTLSRPATAVATVDWSTAPDSASSPSDFVTASGTVTFMTGQHLQTVTVTANGDTTFETNEGFFVNLSAPSGATIADSQGVGTITNDDAMPSLTINDVTQAETNSGTTTFSFSVTLTPASGVQATVNYTTANVSATAGSDYVAASGMLTFAPGETTKPISVTVSGDTLFEPNETFNVTLSGASMAAIGDGMGVGTITNDDIPPARVFVSVLGLDTNDCSNVLTPCRTLNAAIGQVATDGEVIVTRSGSYAGGTITKSAKINAASGVVAFSGQPITVNSGGGTTVVLRGLTLKAVTPGSGTGLLIQSAGSVFVESCVIDGWEFGILQQGAAEVFVKDSAIRNNSTGLYATTGNTSLDNARLTNNGIGIGSDAAGISVRGSTLSGNTTAGIYADSSSSVTVDKCQITNNGSGVTLPAASLSTARLSRSVVSGNGIGLENMGGTLEVNGTNVIQGNTTNTTGTITATGLQ